MSLELSEPINTYLHFLVSQHDTVLHIFLLWIILHVSKPHFTTHTWPVLQLFNKIPSYYMELWKGYQCIFQIYSFNVNSILYNKQIAPGDIYAPTVT